MIITVLADVLGIANNGTTIAAMNLINFLKDQGHTVRIVCCDKAHKGDKDYYIVNRQHHGLLIDYIIKLNGVVLSKPQKDVLYEAIKGSDIVHAMMPFALGCHGSKIAKKLGIPVSAGFHVQAENFTAHILCLKNPLVSHWSYKFYNHRLYRRVDAIHFPTEFIKKEFFSHVKSRGQKTYVISNGVNDRYKHKDIRLDETKGKFSILFIGRLSREKRQKLLIKGVSKSKYKNQIQLFFAGDGFYKKSCYRMAKRCRINTPIISFYNRDQLVDLINSMDLYCHASYAEIEAISCLEAMSCGLVPIINNSKKSATRFFAHSEKNLFKQESAKDLARAIDYWIEHPEEKEQEKLYYLSHRQDYDQKECMKRMEEMFFEIINNHHKK